MPGLGFSHELYKAVKEKLMWLSQKFSINH